MNDYRITLSNGRIYEIRDLNFGDLDLIVKGEGEDVTIKNIELIK